MTTPTPDGPTHVDIEPLSDGRARMVIRRSPRRFTAVPVCSDTSCEHDPCPAGPCTRAECADELLCPHVPLQVGGPMTLSNSFEVSLEQAGRMWRQLGALLLAHDASGTVSREMAERGAAIRAQGRR